MDNIWQKILEIKQERQKAILCIVVEAKGSTPRKPGSKLLVTGDGKFFGTVGGGDLEYRTIEEARKLLVNPQSRLMTFNLSRDLNMACGGQVSVYFEPLLPASQLVIFGGGHVGQALATMAANLDFDIVVVEPRKDVLDSWNSKENVKFVIKDYLSAIDEIKFDKDTYICSMTFGHEYDLEIAARCLKKDFAYLGVLASRNKAAKFARALVQKYGYSDEDVKQIDMPMGVPIACETPQEIAISILARLVDLKNKLSKNVNAE